MKKEKNKYVLFIIFLYFFLFKALLHRYISIIGYFDELIALSAVPIFFIYNRNHKLRISKNGYVRYLLIFILIGLLGNIIYSYQSLFKVALPDLFLCIKFWLSIYVGKFIFIDFNLSKNSTKIFLHIKLITWIFFILAVIDIIHGLDGAKIFYSHPTVLVINCVFITSILVSIKDYINQKEWMLYFIILLVIMCLTFRSKAFGICVIFVSIYYIVYVRKSLKIGRKFLLIIPIVIFVVKDKIVYYFFSDIQNDSARYQLLTKSINIANDYFPIGSGFGTFASYYSGKYYSPLYYIYNISNVNGLREGSATFVSDSFWPMILAQTGWIGSIFFIIALSLLLKKIYLLKTKNISYYVSGLFIILYLLIASTAESAFVHPAAIPLAIYLGYLVQMGEKKYLF